jgi:tetratricopeptide (TPR) repeat protein
MRSSSRRFFNQQSEIKKSSIVLRREATMKKHSAVFIFVFLLLGLCVPPGFSQAAGTVKGVCKDGDGKPIADAVVVWANQENGQKYTLKTNKKGEYFSLGITPSKDYTVTLYRSADDAKANKELLHFGKVAVSLDEKELDFDLKKEAEEQAKGTGLTAEQIKQQQEAQEKQKKEVNTVKALNEKITTANAAMKNGDFDSAIATLTEATQMDASRDILWAQLADAYRGSAVKQTDSAEKKKRLEEAATDYGKAIDIKQKAVDAGTKKPEDAKQLAAYYNNLGEAASKSGKFDEAVKAYEQAAQVNPEGAAGYYYNAGAVLTNAGKADEAIKFFDKCIAADPNKAEAYYQKGVNLIAKETLDKDNKAVAPAGTAEAFQKYLELAPTGPYSDVAKQMLASIGASVETGFGAKKKPAPKK